ncbi:tRNA (adenosine(37)-N6)-threonylcarbamoyltransferase complex dimerization subunit type 1 TsaB [Demequina sp. TTPB684]|uniref:tRNA (adenosine(37)-N6)-threonylcarbamoyltransferase complex dimerization subunit type 1 TsaB n=1 Tax=unclassified Demequina TaxID=2620311 RepID=UPI001CF0E87C|nr:MULTISPECIES: tRNA (adenosine(37)-N6)-threonylcarbamoyltransferase complex dimerization subunit type 1 TsaB [unclassified Demequina]MCB2412933.1 tRNA (adenosine(37)-N6)-threonylcarbamoyltransferase complex dimerization subunit type 1 TsaB [Demequina sp. TTPB684]UPU88439.1 tRNA (adenosine(37)-N6)-threonylcarbamoyltransferase complex dimerization subunit type 1 TsaB [Demequina sp. TMPB413]
MILSLDTSSAMSVALTDADAKEALARRSVFAPRGHAEHLTDLVRQVLDEAAVSKADVTAVAVGTGPAPFTGLRVGLVTARMLAFAWGVPVWGVCSLDALGAQAKDAVVVGDARRREVYVARYVAGLRTEGPAVLAPAQVEVRPEDILVGRGATAYPEAFPGATEADPDPLWLAREALRRLAAGEDVGTEPLYLRRPDVHGA